MSVWTTDENNSSLKHNQKLLCVQNGNQLNSLPITSEGQLIFSTDNSNSSFPKEKLRVRLTGNSSWSGRLLEGDEVSTTYLTADENQSVGGGLVYMRSFTLPSTEKFYLITGIEWKNGSATVNGSMQSAVFLKTSNNSTPYVAIGQAVAQGSINTTQRVSVIRSRPILAGTVCYAAIRNSGTGTVRATAAGTNRDQRTIAYTATPPTSEIATISIIGSDELSLIVYYRGYS